MDVELANTTAAVARMLVVLTTIGLLLLKVTAILAIAFVADRSMIRCSAAQRHHLWSVALGSVLMLTALTAIVPALNVRIKTSALAMSILQARPGGSLSTEPLKATSRLGSYRHDESLPLTVADVSTDESQQFTAIGVNRSESANTPLQFSESFLLNFGKTVSAALLVWVFGMAFILARLANSHRWLARVVKGAQEIVDPVVIDCGKDLAEQLQLKRSPHVLMHTSVTTPCMAGWRRPIVLLPDSAEEWTPDRMRAVLSHEFAHVSRNDYLTQLLATITCAIYWFHPAVWFAARRLRNECEMAADDCAIARIPSVHYAQHLLALADRASRLLSTPAIALGLARTSQLESRIRAMLNAGTSRALIPQRVRRISSVGALLVLVPVSALRTVDGVVTLSSLGHAATQLDGAPFENSGHPQLVKRASLTIATPDSIIDRVVDVRPYDILSLKLEATDAVVFHASGAPMARVRAVMPHNVAVSKDVSLRRLSIGAELRLIGKPASAAVARYEIWIPANMRIFVQSANIDRMRQLEMTTLKMNANGIEIDGQLNTWCARAVLAHIQANLHGRISCGPYALADSRYSRVRVTINGTQLADTIEIMNSSGQSELAFAKLMGITIPDESLDSATKQSRKNIVRSKPDAEPNSRLPTNATKKLP